MLLTRIATALVAIPLVVLGILFLPTFAVGIVVAMMMLVGAWEWGALLRLVGSSRFAFVAATLVVMAVVATTRASDMALGSENLIMALAALLWLAEIGFIAWYPRGWGTTMGHLSVAVPVGLVALSAPVAAITYLHEADDGPLLVLVLLFIVWAADTGAYFAGKGFGRHKLAARVSPGKTREGALGGIAAAVIIAGIGALLLGYDAWRTLAMILLGGWVAVMSIVGDLTISMFKRAADIKDSGTLFPGHGGVLDRLDSLIAAAPWFVLGLHCLPSQF